MSGAVARATEAFEKTLEELDLEERIHDPATLGRRAALLAVADSIWDRFLGPLLDLAQTKVLLGVRSRQAVNDLVQRGRLLAIEGTGGRKLYPAFQFGADGRPFPQIADILGIFADVVESHHTIASWMVSPKPLLGDETPAGWMRSAGDSALLLEVARRGAARLAR